MLARRERAAMPWSAGRRPITAGAPRRALTPAAALILGLAHVLWPVLALAPATRAHADRFHIVPGAETTRVRFDSKATMESFHGDTRQASGYVVVDPADLTDSVEVYVEVDLASLDTGISKRNQDMRENHLETDRFPAATFRGARLLGEHPGALSPGQAVRLEIEGDLTLHGVTRRIHVPVDVTHDASKSELRVVCRFPVLLRDHEIPRPKFLFLRLGEEQIVTFDVVAAMDRPAPVGDVGQSGQTEKTGQTEEER